MKWISTAVRILFPAALALTFFAPSFSFAAEVQPWDEYAKLIKTSENVGALGPTLFGDEVDFNSGSLSFSTTDVSLPGNNKLAVAFSRKYVVSNRKGYTQNDEALADWQLDTPHLSGTFATTWPNQRCSVTSPNAALPPTITVVSKNFSGTDYWQGNQASLPGGGEMLLVNAASQKPTSGGPYYWMTAGQTYFSCLPSIKNGSGEGFLAITADGTKYWFDYLAQYAAPTLQGTISSLNTRTGQCCTTSSVFLPRKLNVLYATRVEDRFGNSVTYTYTNTYDAPAHLTGISSSDGRQLTVGYNPQGQVASVSNGLRAWSYTYSYPTPTTGTLTGVGLPDGSSWTIAFSNFTNAAITYQKASQGEVWHDCFDPGDVISPGAVGTITHPSGAVGQFTVAPVRHGRTNVPAICGNYSTPSNDPNDDVAFYPMAWDALSLTQKRLSGPGLTTVDWNYSYTSPSSYFYPSGIPVCPAGADCSQPRCTTDACAGSSTTEIAGPGGQWTRYTFGNSYRYNEGKLLKVEQGSGPTNILRTKTTTYQLALSGQQFPTPVGSSPQIRGDGFTSEYVRPQLTETIAQDGANFSSQVAATCNGNNTYCFDRFARPTVVIKVSSLNPGRTEATVYADSFSKWVLGQVASVTCTSCPGVVVMSRTDYDTNAMPWRTYSPVTGAVPGKLLQTLTYNLTVGNDQTGTLATVTDGNNKVTTLSSWSHGIPRLIQYPVTAESPGGASVAATVDGNGWITATSDENGYSTNYQYDQMGRMKTITYPTADSTVWKDTTQSFVPITAVEYGIESGHWKQVVSTGNGRKETYFDALWRPLVTREYDTANVAGTQRFTRMDYDDAGHLDFTSYPGTVDALSAGTWTTYDKLDRVVSVSQDSEMGLLTASTKYLTGFKTQVTNPRNKVTTTSYTAYDQPTTDWPVAIVQPAGVYTDIVRDPFGKTLSIARHNASGSLSATRSYFYDSYQQLCAQVEPETGTTVMDYDGANNLLWSASGLASSVACNRADASVAPRKVVRTYDGLNRVTTLRFPDGQGDQDWAYTPDGLPAQVTAYNGANQTAPVITAYHYNKRRMLDGQGEDVSQPGWYSWGIGYGYDGNGHLSVQTYPDSSAVTFAPNALGQPTQAGTYASAVSYYPNGAIHQFTYGNGIVHTMTQNARQLPIRSTDGTAFDFGYGFDADGNVGSITDYAQAGRQSRTMTYDDLDRLSTTSSPMFNGTIATYGYNELDDLISVKAPASTTTPARNQTYWYDPATRHLTNVADAETGASVIGISYDPQGNVSNKNGRLWEFDFGNRLRMVHDGTSVVEAYRYDGLGRRVLEWNAGGNIVSQYAKDGQLLYQSNGRMNQALAFVYLGGSLVAISSKQLTGGAATVKYQHTDALGTPVAVTSANQTVVERSEYDPFGGLLNRAITDGPGFTGHVQDAATGMTYMQQRYYDPQVGRFLSVDPVGTDSRAGANFNRYSYAADNPHRFFDPDGRCTGSHIENTDGTCASTGGNTTLSIGPISGRSSAPELNFAVKSGVRLSPALESQVSNLADSYQNRTGKKLVVTDGLRSPREQASRMLYKITHGEGVSIYSNHVAANAVMNAYLSSSRDGSNPLDSMARIISGQMAKGTYLSDHLLNDAADFRSTDVSRSAFREAADVAGASKVIDEKVPSHLHVEY